MQNEKVDLCILVITNTNKIYIAPGILKRIRAQTHGVTRRLRREKKGMILVAIWKWPVACLAHNRTSWGRLFQRVGKETEKASDWLWLSKRMLRSSPCDWYWLVAWHSGRTSVFDQWTFPVLRSTYSWQVTTYVGKPSAIGQPTRPPQPFILSGSINE